MIQIEEAVVRQALEALEIGDDASLAERDTAITALRQALEQPAQLNWHLTYLHSAMEYIRENHPQVYAECGDTDEFRADRLKELEQPAPVPEAHEQSAERGEPVAMQMDVIVVNLVREGINKHRARELAEHFIKHTRPQAPVVPPHREPLTDEQLESIWAEFGLVMQSTRKVIARAIEAAHGIGEKK